MRPFRALMLLPATLLLGSLAWAQSADEFRRQALRMASLQQLDEAVSLLELGLAQYPQSPELWLQLGGILVYKGDTARGEAALEQALRLNPFDPAVLRRNAEARLRQGRLAAAAELLRKALWHSDTDAATHQRMAFTLFLQGREDPAREHARKSVELDPLSPENRRLYALLLQIADDQRAALDQLRFAYRLDPTDVRTLYRLSLAQQTLGNLGQALEYAVLAAELDPENPLYWTELANLNRSIGDEEGAREAEEKAKQLKSAYEDYFKALSLLGQRRTEAAISALQKLRRDHPSFATSKLLLADLERKRGHRQAALEVYREVLDQDPRADRAREETAWLEFEDGSIESAIELLRGAESTLYHPELLEGYQLLLNRQWEAALERFRVVQKDAPLMPGLLELISWCLNELGRKEEALSNLAKAQRVAPADSQIDEQIQAIRFEEAAALQEKGLWRESIQVLTPLIRENPGRAEYLLSRGYARQKLHLWEPAVQDYRSGLALDPGANWARINLATSLYRLTRYREATVEWEKISASHPDSESFLRLGLCYSHLDRQPEAESAFEKALQLGGDSPELLYNLGVTRLRLFKVDEAWRLIREAAQKGYPPAAQLLHQARLKKP